MPPEMMTIYTLGMFYTGVGHAPHPPGTALTLPKPQAETWIKDGVASASPPIQSPAISDQSSKQAASPAEHETPASH